MLKAILTGVILTLAIILGGAYYYFSQGKAPVATSEPPMPFEETFAHMALKARIAKEAPAGEGAPADETNLLAGAQVYRANCAVCHGLSDAPESAITKGMFPKPPQLLKGKGVTDDPAGETYWKVKNGIRLTGMPAYGSSLTDTQLWQVSMLLAKADKLTPAVKKVLAEPLVIK